jgi:outer membrane protein TolC
MQKNIQLHGLIFGAALVLTSSAQAITLHEAVSEALGTSPVIERAKSVTEEAKWKKVEGYAGFLPSLSANASYLLDKKYALTNINFGGAETIVPQIIPNSQLTLTATYPIFEGFASTNRLHAANEGLSAANNEFEWNKFKIEMDITLAYYRTLANKILKSVAEQNLKVLNDHLKDVKLFKSSGMATNYDVLRVEVQVSNAETDLLNAQDNIVISEQNLLELLGKNSGTIEVNGELPVLDDKLLNSLAENNVQTRLDIQALKNRIEALSYTDKAQNSYFIPRLSLFGQYQYYNNLNTSLTDTDMYRSAYQVGLQFTWNIFDAGTSFSRSRQTTEQFVQAEKSYRITELRAQKDLEIWKRKFNYSINLYKARNNDIAKSKESVRLAREGRRVGARTNTELLDAESDLYKSQAGAVNAQLGAIEALVNLQTSIGQKIYNF